MKNVLKVWCKGKYKKILKKIYNIAKGRYIRLISDNYYDYYLKKTKSNVFEDPKGSVGPAEKFQEMRRWQINFLKKQGLEKNHKLLDIGCGTLRGGVKFIDYLNRGNYYGMDISEDCLLVGYKELIERDLTKKKPVLIKNEDLKFEEFNTKFDYIFAQSVLTHLPKKHTDELFENINKVMHEDSKFLFTFYKGNSDVKRRFSGHAFEYSENYLSKISRENGLKFQIINQSHPNNLDIAMATKR